jgi:serine-type D-Ala-D-Ala carboxypeptidase/endopeptidase (penicillin-binding protein 4)
VRRRLAALGLAAVAVLSGGMAAVAEADEGASSTAAVTQVAPTPVLSARRVPALLVAPIADRRLTAALDGVLARQPGTACLTVSASGRAVYAREPDTPLTPASVEKLLTAVAAVEVLGADHRFRTTVVTQSPPADGVVAGDVWLVGGGDALLSTADYPLRFRFQPQAATPVEQLADAVVAAGITRIEGRLLGDESRYDTERYIELWPERFFTQDQTGPMSALSVNDSWLTYPPRFDVFVPDEVPAPDPAAHAADVLASLLADRGVTIAGGAASGVAPDDVDEVAAVESVPLDEYVAHVVRMSDSHAAELLLKEIAVGAGRPGTSADGAAVVAEVIARLELPPPAPVVVDGSGLAAENRISCAGVQALLDRLGPDDVAFEGLPVGGETGTLAIRFVNHPATGRLRAKTGTLNQVTSLAGFLDTLPGATLTFSFMVNLSSGDVVDGEDLSLQEELVAVMARYPEGPSEASVGPVPLPG